MKSAIIFSFLLLCLTTVSQAQNLNKAYAAMEEGDWEVALGMLEPIIKKNAKNNEAKFLAAICHTERYRLEQAIGLFNESTAFAQDSPYFWVKFAKAYLLNEQIDEDNQKSKNARLG